MKRVAFFAILLWLHAGTLLAGPVTLAPVFGDQMVLPRDVPVPIWGTTDGSAAVSIHFAGQNQTTRANADGKWKITLNAMPASTEPRDLQIESKSKLILHDLLVGDVWLAAGQSNMEFPLSRELHFTEELHSADQPNLRLLNCSFAGQYVFGKPFDQSILDRLTPDRFYSGNWAPSSAKSARAFSAIGYYFGKQLQENLGVPIGIINIAVGGSPTEAWVRRQAMADDSQLRWLVEGNWLTSAPQDDWCKQRGRENLGAAAVNTTDPTGPNHAFKPGFLWQAGPAQLIPFPIRGVIWYQGESNSLTEPRMRQHEALFKTLVSDWRKCWGIADLPFLYCQLSGIGTDNYKSQFWPDFRDQQRRLLAEIPNTAMAVTSDFGNKNDVHPREKREIGNRLAAAAMALVYGSKQEGQGPLAESITRHDHELIVHFTHAAGLTTSDGSTVRGFEIADKTGSYVPAQAIADGSTVHLSSNQVSDPVSARYDWQPFPDGNLINSSHLPCSTFSLSGNPDVR